MKQKIFLGFIFMIGFGLLYSQLVKGSLVVSIRENQQICYETVPDTLTSLVTGGSGDYNYLWQDSSLVSTSWETIDGANKDFYLPPALKKTTFYRLIVHDNQTFDADTSDALIIAVYEQLVADPITGGPLYTICHGDAVTLYAHPKGGSGHFQITWYKFLNDSIGTGNPLVIEHLYDTTYFHYVVIDDSCGTESSVPVMIEVYNLLDADPITGGPSDTICYKSDAGTLHSHPKGGSGNYTISWLIGNNPTGIAGDSLVVGELEETTDFRYVVTDDSCGSKTSNPFKIKVYGQLVATDIIGGNSPICNGQNGGTLKAFPTGGSRDYTIKWYNQDGLLWVGDSILVGNLLDTSSYYYRVEDNKGCDTLDSDTFTCIVYSPFEKGTISGGSTPICPGEDGGTLQANPSGGSLDYTFQWFDSQNNPLGSNETLNVGNLTETKEYYYKVTDNKGCGIGNSPLKKILVEDSLTASVSINASPNKICLGDVITFTAIPSPPNNIQYKWYINNVLKSTSSSYPTNEIINGDSVKVEITYLQPTCVINNPAFGYFKAIVNPIPDSSAIVAKPKNNPVVLIYPGDTTGHHYDYQWYRNGQAINGETSKFYYNDGVVFLPGTTYSVRVENEFNCSVELEYTRVIDKSSLFEESDVFVIYPNPNNGAFTISFNDDRIPDDAETFNLQISDLSGKVVTKKELPCNDQSINMTGLKKGVYFVEVTIGNDYRQLRKLVIY
jgi:hypothetical protein